jgi:hypothetical protein
MSEVEQGTTVTSSPSTAGCQCYHAAAGGHSKIPMQQVYSLLGVGVSLSSQAQYAHQRTDLRGGTSQVQPH